MCLILRQARQFHTNFRAPSRAITSEYVVSSCPKRTVPERVAGGRAADCRRLRRAPPHKSYWLVYEESHMISTVPARLAIAITTLLAVIQLSGCVSTLTEEEQYERDALQAERMDEIRGFITACVVTGYTVVYDGPKKHKLLDPIKHVTRNAHRSDYGCTSRTDIERVLRGSGSGI